jgi:hypothetical protein
MLDEMTLRLVAPMEQQGYFMPNHLMPDISMGKMFCKWCRENGYEPDDFPTYTHYFDDGKRPSVQAKLYPNHLLASFRKYFHEEWLLKRAANYFEERDSKALVYLNEVLKALPKPEDVGI